MYKKILNYCLIFVLLNFPTSFAYSKTAPSSFADLAEKLMPSVVNISSTQTIKTTSNPFPFQFPPGSPFEDMFKEFNTPTERKATALGSGFIIDKKGIVVTNNHVIQGAEDILVSVNGSEYKAEVIGTDPLSTGVGWLGQMVSHPLPNDFHNDIKSILLDEYKIEIPIFEWKDQKLIRISIQVYNDRKDLESLMSALESIK